MIKFQMVGSTNLLTIAEVIAEHDILSFRNDPGWYEIKEETPVVSLNEVPKVTHSKNKAKEEV